MGHPSTELTAPTDSEPQHVLRRARRLGLTEPSKKGYLPTGVVKDRCEAPDVDDIGFRIVSIPEGVTRCANLGATNLEIWAQRLRAWLIKHRPRSVDRSGTNWRPTRLGRSQALGVTIAWCKSSSRISWRISCHQYQPKVSSRSPPPSRSNSRRK